jgi:hypothetical protein
MNRGLVVLVVILLTTAGSAAVLTDAVTAPDEAAPAPATPSGADGTNGATSGDGGGGGDGATAGDATATPATPPFSFTIDSLESCGQTCRDVTATVTNERDTAATDVTVATRIYAGKSTGQNARIWTGSEAVGTLAPGASATSTARVKLGFVAAAKVKQHDGWITVVTTVESEETTYSFESHRQVI